MKKRGSDVALLVLAIIQDTVYIHTVTILYTDLYMLHYSSQCSIVFPAVTG